MSAIPVQQEAIADLCRRWGIRRLALFGSAVTGELRPDSDVDVLVEFRPDRVVGLIRLYDLECELSDLFDGRRIDLITPKALNHRIRQQVLNEAEVQYAEG